MKQLLLGAGLAGMLVGGMSLRKNEVAGAGRAARTGTAAGAGAAFAAGAGSGSAAGGPFIVDTLATGLVVPWDILFTPEGDMIFGERQGRVRLYRHDQLVAKPLLVIPDIEVRGKMGLLGMCLHPRFASNRLLYLAHDYRRGEQTFFRVMRYKYAGDSLTDGKLMIEGLPGAFNHTGSRLAFGPDGKLYITVGDADVPRLAQDLKAFNGKILRLNDDGSIPPDNPFVANDTALRQVWSYGHRNPQGLVFQPGTGVLFESEHGPTGGDEINIIARGKNYGWPEIHHRDTREGIVIPQLEFSPSIGPAEALFYSGKAFPEMKGNLLVGCMRGEAILRMRLVNNMIASYDFLLKKQYGRIRAVAEGPDGYLYISTSMVDPPETNLRQGERGYDMLLRLRPSGVSSAVADGGGQVTAAEGQPAMFGAVAGAAGADERERAGGGERERAGAGSGGAGGSAGGKKPVRRNMQQLYAQLCASCHGDDLNGKDKVPSLIDGEWLNGGTRQAIRKSITQGIVSKGMPSWGGVLTPTEIDRMISFIIRHKKGIKN